MKKVVTVILVLICVFCLFTACGEKTDLLPDASPETSGLGVYYYGGEEITLDYLFGTDTIKEVLGDFNGITADKADVDKTSLQPPFYGIEIGGTDGFTVYGLWADDYFIHEDGNVYNFDYDFEALFEEYPFERLSEFDSLSVMPLSHYVAKSDDGWNKEFLTQAQEQIPTQKGVSLTLKEQTDEYILGEYQNASGTDFGYGHAFSLDTKIDGKWYTVPAETDIAFTEELMVIFDDTSAEEKFNISAYGELPKGEYRISTQGFYIEFSK